MTAGIDPARLAKLARQHAMTSRLTGVDCLPVRGGFPSAPSDNLPELIAPSPAMSTAPRQVPRPPAQTPRPAPAAPASSPVADEPAVVIEPKPVVTYTDPERIAAQKKLDAILARYIKDAPHQHFVTDHHSIVFGEGDPRARLMFVGEAPGAEEDKVGRPFVGRAGQLLNKMIEALGLRREQVYIANILKTRPPNNATPTMEECARCAPYLYEQIEAIQPEVIVTLGLPATRVLLNTMESMGNLRGKWSTFTPPGISSNARSVPVMPTYHPAFLLRAYTRENRQKVWSDLLMAADRLGLKVPARTADSGADKNATG